LRPVASGHLGPESGDLNFQRVLGKKKAPNRLPRAPDLRHSGTGEIRKDQAPVAQPDFLRTDGGIDAEGAPAATLGIVQLSSGRRPPTAQCSNRTHKALKDVFGLEPPPCTDA